MQHLLGAGSNLLNATVHLRSSRQLCGSPRKNLADIRHLPQLELMITIQTTFACYDIPFVQKATCAPASIHRWQLVCTPAEHCVPAQVMLPTPPAGALVSCCPSGFSSGCCGAFHGWGRLGVFRDTWKGDVAQCRSPHSGERVLSGAWFCVVVWQQPRAASHCGMPLGCSESILTLKAATNQLWQG